MQGGIGRQLHTYLRPCVMPQVLQRWVEFPVHLTSAEIAHTHLNALTDYGGRWVVGLCTHMGLVGMALRGGGLVASTLGLLDRFTSR